MIPKRTTANERRRGGWQESRDGELRVSEMF